MYRKSYEVELSAVIVALVVGIIAFVWWHTGNQVEAMKAYQTCQVETIDGSVVLPCDE